MFRRLQTQWVYAGMGSIIGLNYQSAEFLFRIYRVKNPRKLFEQLRLIERGVLNVRDEQAQKGS